MIDTIVTAVEDTTEITIRVKANSTREIRNRQGSTTIDSTIISIGVREIPLLNHREKDLCVAIAALGRHDHQILYPLILCSIPNEIITIVVV